MEHNPNQANSENNFEDDNSDDQNWPPDDELDLSDMDALLHKTLKFGEPAEDNYDASFVSGPIDWLS